MKEWIKGLSQGLYDAINQREHRDLFSYEEILENCEKIVVSCINKVAVLIGIFIIQIYLWVKGIEAPWFFSTAMILWLAWLVSTSAIAAFYREYQKRK